MRSIGRLLASLLALAVVASACSSKPSAAAQSSTPASSGARSASTSPAPVGSIATSAKASSGKEAPPTVQHFGSPGASPEPVVVDSTVPITASISKPCIAHGETQVLTVVTVPHAKVTYETVYSDSQLGFAPPQGKGYGGGSTTLGYADAKGRFSDRWVIAPNAPAGKARAYAFSQVEKGHTNVAWAEFKVAGPTGAC